MNHMFLVASCLAAAIGCAPEADAPNAFDSVADDADRITFVGTLNDSLERPLGGSVVMRWQGQDVGASAPVDPITGEYRIDVPRSIFTDAPSAASLQAAQLVFTPAVEDRAPFGTVEGDPVRALPITIVEFTDRPTLHDAATVELRPAHAPLQGRGYAVPGGTVAQTRVLHWGINDPLRGHLGVELTLAAGTRIDYPAGAPEEISLTHVLWDQAPMTCPEDTTCLVYTIQPSGVRFDPPLEIRITGDTGFLFGDTPPALGDRFPFRLASPFGWEQAGDVEVDRVDHAEVRFRSVGGLIHSGAWGHVIGSALLESAMVLTVQHCDGTRVRARVRPSPVISQDQPDYVDWLEIIFDDGQGAVRLLCDEPRRAPIYLTYEGEPRLRRVDVECLPGEVTFPVHAFDPADGAPCE